ncbi:MAG: hypothetical protein ACK5KU_12180, partial [Beutenbergiaceae bacterium]
ENNIPFDSWEIFLNNPNANRLIDDLNMDEWIVIGNAMDICVDLVVANLVEHNHCVLYVPELMVPSPKCAGCDPEVFKQHVYDRWHTHDVRPIVLNDLLDRMSLSAAV